jgi:hypothetical protein
MIGWTHPHLLWLLCLLPLAVWAWAEGLRPLWRLLKHHSLPQAVRPLALARLAAKTLALAAALVALAGPYTTVPPTTQDTQLQIFFVLDASTSMDVPDAGGRTRLEVARLAATQLADSLRGHRMGVIGFADFAYTYVPLTEDYPALRLHLQDIRSDQFAQGHTRMRAALQQLAAHFITEGDTANWQPGGQVALLFSDGETREPSYASKLRLLRDMGVPLIPVTVGSTQGGAVPGKQDPATGKAAWSVPHPARMDSIAQMLGTTGYRLAAAPDTAWVQQVLRTVRSTPPRPPRRGETPVPQQLFFWPLSLAMLSLLASLWLRPRTRTPHA